MNARNGDEFRIHLVTDFNERLKNTVSFYEWDSVYASLIWKLRRNPTINAHNIEADLWMAYLESYPSLFVFYTVDQAAKIVLLTNLRRL